MKPFRWNIQKREQLGRLVSREFALPYEEFISDLRCAASRVLASAGDARLVFLGRSPENIFDYLSGALQQTRREGQLELVNVSLRSQYVPEDKTVAHNAQELLRNHLTEHNLTPEAISSGDRAVSLVDFVATGKTFRSFVGELEQWAADSGVDVAAVRRRLRIVGITWQTKTSPNTFRWHQDAEWLQVFPRIAVKNVSVPGLFWDTLGNRQPKVSPSHPLWRWGDPESMSPPHHERNMGALALALSLYSSATQRDERLALCSELVKEPAMREAWFRSLVQEVRAG